MNWHQSYLKNKPARLPARTVEAVAARNRAAAALREALPQSAAGRRLMTAGGVFVKGEK